MSELETNYSLYDQLASPEPAAGDEYADWTDDEITAWLDDDSGDEEEYEDEEYETGLPETLEQMVADAMRRGLSSSEAMLESRQRADAEWQQIQARNAYDAHVRETHALRAAREEGNALITDAAERHDVREAGATGRLEAIASDLFTRARTEAFDVGDEETFAWLNSPEGAATAIEAAAEIAYLQAAGSQAYKPSELARLRTPYAQRQREAYDLHERSK